MLLRAKYNDKVTVVEEKPKRFRWALDLSDAPREIFNKTLYLSVFVFGVLGAARGLDEGNIAGSVALAAFKKQFGLADPNKTKSQLANLKSNITSMVQLGSVAGALLAMFTVDRLGRIWALRLVCVIWIVAVIIEITSYKVGQLYAGRFIEGLAIGQTTTIGPSYLSEVAPKQIRGMCNCIFAGAVYLGIMLSYFANYGTALHISNDSRKQWVAPTSMKIIMAGLILIMSFLFCIESPRWLLKVNRQEEAIEALSKIRHLPKDHSFIVGEISDINELIQAEKAAAEGTTIVSLIKEFLLVKSNRYRFFVVAAAAQVLGQWSGANAVTIYAPELFAIVGITGVDKMKMTAILGVVKFVLAYLSAFFLIDFLGRRRLLYIGITLQGLCLLYFAIFLTVVPQALVSADGLTNSQKAAGRGALAALFLSGTGWTMGFNAVQYLLGSEIFPLNIRAFAQLAVMVLHFANQYGNSKALPKMMIALHPYGSFYFFSAVCALSLFWAWFFIPEVAGRSLESMEEIFNLPWYMVGRRGPALCPDYTELGKIHYAGGTLLYDDGKVTEEFVEDIGEKKEPEETERKHEERV